MITIVELPSGYFHIRGDGPCNWAQPPCWPCDELTLREHAFPEAGEDFIREALRFTEEQRRMAPMATSDATHDSRRLWKIDDGERHYIMAPTAEQALAFWRSDVDCDESEPDITDITDRAETMIIRSDDDAGGPPKNARMWMDEDDAEVAMIGSSVW